MDMHTVSRSSKCNLPSEKVFSIQIGSEIFRLSGASIASDAPSYFSRFFEDQLLQNQDAANVRTLYIDRDPTTFREIARHLQGYYVRPQDGAQFVKLFADAQFYTLPRLMSQLFESECFIQIGDRHFQIPRDIFSGPGDSPNFFTLGFAAFFASPTAVFPGLDRQGLLRPPAIVPPSVPNRSADVFDELLHMLRGYPLHIRNEDHRAALLRDCRYFHLRGLEQKLIPHQITTNPFTHRLEIVIRLEDVRPSGIQFAFDTASGSPALGGMVTYTRPFVDESAADLVVEIGDETSLIHQGSMRADFLGLAKQRITSLLQTVGKKMNLPNSHPPLGQVLIKVRIDRETDLTVDGEQDPQHLMISRAQTGADAGGVPPAKRPRVDNTDDAPWVVRTGQWRLQVQRGSTGAYEVVLVAVKLDIYTSARVRNQSRKFL
ncbi:Potassium channel, voltage dependent, Kv, tetramerisation [Penicillium camemberti]|uniref:Potassium channel, voltage dependent, Kv, tetramerisation n=1 Tax=Penicillium camemberti (strain FM 013) TaxID=1429867 RepID=A0A0G4PKZ6_PENC3|nr:Potassium channel, voltage dependent, Kv, tetramerisation [Penicillium camemberti]